MQGREVVLDINYLNTEHLGTQEYDRRAVFDVYCKNDKGEVFLVEMQKGEQQFFKDRSIYYSTFAIREQAPRGEWNYELKGVYTIGILNFCFDKEREGNYYHEVKLMDTATKEVFYDKLVFIYLEMPKFTKQENELESLFDKWLYVIRNLAALMERPRVLQEKVFAHLFEAAEIAKFSRVERYEYEESLKAYRDWFSVMATAELRGEERGKEKGLKEGLEKGRIEERLRNARGLKARGVDADIIAQVTGLSVDEYLSLVEKSHVPFDVGIRLWIFSFCSVSRTIFRSAENDFRTY